MEAQIEKLAFHEGLKALYGSQNECAKTDNIFPPIFEFCDGTVSLMADWQAVKPVGAFLDPKFKEI